MRLLQPCRRGSQLLRPFSLQNRIQFSLPASAGARHFSQKPSELSEKVAETLPTDSPAKPPLEPVDTTTKMDMQQEDRFVERRIEDHVKEHGEQIPEAQDFQEAAQRLAEAPSAPVPLRLRDPNAVAEQQKDVIIRSRTTTGQVLWPATKEDIEILSQSDQLYPRPFQVEGSVIIRLVRLSDPVTSPVGRMVRNRQYGIRGNEKWQLLATGFVCMLMVFSLGAWQLRRMKWKRDLIEMRRERLAMPRLQALTGLTRFSSLSGLGGFGAPGLAMSKSVSRELQTQVDPELLRGIPLDLCLSGWARHFRPPDPGMFKVDHSVYHLSKQTEHFDEFLSHDWQTSRWYKFCAMLVIYNSRAAFLSSLVASVSVGSLRAMQVLPNELWTQLATLTVFPLVLCFWQRIRRLIAKPKVVFLDKLCIAQHDEELKQKGIFGLAGFLDHSRQLTIFWSYRYFSRLWCTYEVATFLRAKQKPILVIPVKLAVILCLFSAAEIWVMAGYYLSAYMVLGDEDTDFGQLVTFLTLFTIFYMPTLALVFFIGISMMVEVKELPQQLRDFRVQDAKCFCCSCHHRHPETGELLPCDRELMFQMLKKWFGKAGDLEDEYMERFNQLVHEELAPRVLQDVGADFLPLNYSTYMILVALWPGLCTAIPRMVAGPTDKSISFLQHGIWILRAIMDYVMLVVLAISALRLSLRAWLIAVRFLPRWSRLACSFFMPAVLLLYLSIQWLSFQITLRFTDEDSLLPAIPFAIWTCALYCTWTSDATRNIMPSTGTQPVSEEVLPSSVGQSIFDEDSMSTFST